jgi:hypothetical protein
VTPWHQRPPPSLTPPEDDVSKRDPEAHPVDDRAHGAGLPDVHEPQKVYSAEHHGAY